HHSYAVVHVLIDIRHIGDVIHGVVVVHIRDLDHRDASVGDVYVLDVAGAGPIPGNVDLTRAKRKPSHGSGPNADAESANEGDSSRRVHGTDDNRSRDPSPTTSNERP